MTVEHEQPRRGKRYGALGVIGDDQRLVWFVTHGATADMVNTIGHYPEGHGILGLLIVDPARACPTCLFNFATGASNSQCGEVHTCRFSHEQAPARVELFRRCLATVRQAPVLTG